MVPSVQSPENIEANADLLRRVAAAIGLAGMALVEVCERIVSDIRSEVAEIDSAVRLDAASGTAGDG